MAFLIAITSARRVGELQALSAKEPFLVIHQDKAVLRPVHQFLPKVVSPFHMNQEIVIPSFCPEPKNKKEERLHKLDVVRCLKVYIERMRDIRKSDRLFIIPEGPKKGQAASKTTISQWIVSCI
ncbi:hypothetical protein FKM82_018068 [Ascaphus truei]